MTTLNQTSGILVLPASDGQQRFWVLDQLKKGDPSLNVAVRFSLKGTLDIGALERALNEIVKRHEILRANFELVDGELSQVVCEERELTLQVFETGDPDAIADRFASEPFQVESGPLIRAGLVCLAPEDYILLITIHHIISDGWSIGVITDELGLLYEGFLTRGTAALPGLPIQFADYVLWKRDQGGNREAEDYWTNRLAGAPSFEVMPDMARQSAAGMPGQIVSRLLPVSLTGAVSNAARLNSATLFTTMYAALAALLSRYTGQTDIVVGTQVAGRDLVDVEPLIGPFVNTLVLRCDLSGDPTFTELLSRARETTSGALANQVPFDRVAENLRLDRNSGRNLLFQVNFIHQRDFVRPWHHGGLTLTPIPSRSPGAMYDLNFFMVERADGWRLSCEYNASLYRAATVEAMLGNYQRLLESIVAEPTQRLSEFRFLAASEVHQQLIEWNNTQTPYPAEARIHDLLAGAVERYADRTAIAFEGTTASYRDIEDRSNRLAHYLIGRGAACGEYVGICLDRSIDLYVAVLAVLKTGAAYVPLDPSFPADRLAFMAGDAGVKLIVTAARCASLGGEQAVRVLLDEESAAIAHESGTAPAVPQGDIAYVLYTSGSTGKPKGVEVLHRSVMNLLTAIQSYISLGERDSLLAVTTLSFDIAALELFLPLVTGSRIVLASQAQASDPGALARLLAAERITAMQATPVTWRMLIDAGWKKSTGLKMLCGGEAMTRDLADDLLDRGARLWNVYGPTETTIWSTIIEIERDGEPITIGRPLANTLLYVLDPCLALLPIGAPGELYIGGEGVARGYINRPELTAQRFIPNPYGPGRIYRTGDRARYLPDGRIEMLGRNDSQVKVRGYRIELGEVESALAACPGVRGAAVVVRGNAAGEEILAGYYTGTASAASVREAMGRLLPEYMIPTALVSMAELPVTPNGKIDRKALPAPSTVLAARRAEPGATPADSLESTLIFIWESVLNVRPVHRDDNFFALGGYSILAARMFNRLERAIGKVLPLATLFQAPTVAQLAAVIRDSDWTPLWSSLVPIRPAGTRPPFFFVHPIGGNVLNFAGFAGHFSPDQPVYGIQARGLDGKEAPRLSIGEMARAYVDALRSVQPRGPYYIGGFSAGAIVAYEMARVLIESGHRVGMLALLDSGIDDSPAGSGIRHAFRVALFNLRVAARTPLATFVERKIRNLRMRLRVRRHILLDSLGLHAEPPKLDAEEGFMLALRRYTPVPLDCGATLFRAEDELVQSSDPWLGWKRYLLGEVAIETIPGDHDSILLEPFIGGLAHRLESCLSAARARESQQGGPVASRF